jgi:fatty acid synthase
MTETTGRGVDLVLNSLSEEKLQASVRCLAPQGRFLEIGKFDLTSNNTIGKILLFLMPQCHSMYILHLAFNSSVFF